MINFLQSLLSELTDNQRGGITLARTRKKTESVTTPPVPLPTTKPIAIVEEDEENTVLAIANRPPDLLPQGIIRSEVNFLTLPFFSLSRHDQRVRTEYHAIETRGDKKLEVSWKVSANSEYGYPGVFDSKVHKAIEQIISNLPRPIENPIPLGSLLSLAKLMGVGLSRKGTLPGKSYKEIQDSLTKIVAATVESKGTFYDKGEEQFIDARFHLYDQVVFIGQKLRDGVVADTNYLFLSSWYLDNINARYVKPLDYTYYRTLQSPIASRLYELLGVKFYRGNPYIRYRYSTLCQLLPVTRYQYFSAAKRKLDLAHEELIRTGFLDNVEWGKVKDDPHDWYVNYWAGERAKEERQRFKKQVALPPPDDSVEPTPQPAPTTQAEQVADAKSDLADDVVNALQNFGISKKTAQKLAKNYPQDLILAKLDMVKWLVDTNSPLVSKNPQGFLVKAIEDGYLSEPPRRYKVSKQQEERQKQELEQQRQAQDQFQRAREEAKQKLLEEHPPQPIENTDLTTASAWNKTLESLREQVSNVIYTGWLKDTLLLRLEEDTAFVLVSSHFAREYLEHRLYASIARTLENVIGYPVDVEFVVSDMVS
jgi:hypothetical protein